ncbi:MAG: AmfC protein [Acidobacteria bacterium]|nr:AmfC protein [Acidobacteriota bacterium]
MRSPEFTSGLEELSLAELRARRRVCADLDLEYSYYRRLLQGRLDLLAFEMRRRSGEETRTLIEALPEILASWASHRPGLPRRRVPVEAPHLPAAGRRAVDQVLSDEFLILLSEMPDKDLADVQQRLAEAEAEISRLRRAVFDASDVLQAELVRRYRAGQLANGDPPQG